MARPALENSLSEGVEGSSAVARTSILAGSRLSSDHLRLITEATATLKRRQVGESSSSAYAKTKILSLFMDW